MQAVAQETGLIEESPKPAMRVTIRYEWLAIVALMVFSTIFHLAGLDEIPLTDNEAHQALSAWRSTMPHTSGDPILSDTPLVWWSQKIAFSLIGGSEFSSRVFTALAGVLVSLSPLMFMPILGRSRAYVMTILLGVSPILLTTARMSGSTTWALLMVVMMLWFAWRFYEISHKKYALALIITGGFLALMTESQSILLLMIIISAGVIAFLLTAYSTFMEQPPAEIFAQARARLAQIPLMEGVLLGGLVIFAVATGFMLAPDGLNGVGELLSSFFRGWTTSQQDPLAYRPTEILVFYEIWLIPFALLALGLLIYQGKVTFVERFLLLWIGLALIALIVYPDMGASHASWLVVPMSALMAYVVSEAFLQIAPSITMPVLVSDDRGLLWGKFTVALMMFVLLVLFTAHIQFVSRGALLLQNGTPTQFFAGIGSQELALEIQSRQYVGVSEAMLVSVIVLVMTMIGYFLATTIWGTLVPLQGAIIGMFAFVWMASFGTAWSAGMFRADNPVEMFHYPQATSKQTMLLRDTLEELAFRQSMGTFAIPIAVLAPSDGVLAWVLRDFYNTNYVENVQEAQTYEIVIIPQGGDSPQFAPDLGGDYVGQWLTISTRWGGVPGTTSYWQPFRYNADILKHPTRAFVWEMNLDLMAWWLLREVRTNPALYESILLWVRQDIYDNVPLINPNTP
jgi:hypothetical protein